MINLLTPGRTVLIYLVFGLTWIFTTDSLMRWITSNYPNLLWTGQSLKGTLFVILSTLLLYLLLKKYHRSLHSSEIAYIRIFRESPQPMWIYDVETLRFVDVNDAAINLYGYSLDEFMQMSILQIRPEEEIGKVLDVMKLIGKGFQDFGTWKHRKKNGEIMFVEIRTFTTTNRGKEVEIVSVWDVTEKHKAFDELSKKETLLNAIMNSTEDLIWAVDENRCLTAFNDSYHYAIELFTGKSMKVGDHLVLSEDEDTYQQWQQYYQRSLAGEKHIIEEAKEMAHYGLSYAEITFQPIRQDDKITGVSCFARNITLRKLQEFRLKAALDRYDMVNLATSNVIWDRDLINNTVVYNSNLKLLFGHEPPTNPDWWFKHIHPDDLEKVTNAMNELLTEKQHKWSMQYRLRHANGEYRHVFDRAYVLYNEKGKAFRVIGAIEDIHAETIYIEELKKVAWMSSHGLRRPIASMLGVFEALNKEDLCDPANIQLLGLMEKIVQEMDEQIHVVADKCNNIFQGVQ